jgi:hypothetical protein
VQHQRWTIEPSGEFSAMYHGMHLAVRKHNGFTRFLVLAACGERYPEAILSSGTESNVEAAKTAATRTAIRLEAVLNKSAGVEAAAFVTPPFAGPNHGGAGLAAA